jgi:hypothetical protein
VGVVGGANSCRAINRPQSTMLFIGDVVMEEGRGIPSGSAVVEAGHGGGVDEVGGAGKEVNGSDSETEGAGMIMVEGSGGGGGGAARVLRL